MKVGDQKFVIGMLLYDKVFQFCMEIVVERSFELFYSWKDGSVYFFGYRVDVYDFDLYFYCLVFDNLFMNMFLGFVVFDIFDFFVLFY